MKCLWKINSLIYVCWEIIAISLNWQTNTFHTFKRRNLVFVLKKVRPSRYTLAQLSVLLLAGSVMYLGLYNIWFDLRSRHGWHIFYSILWVFTISSQPIFLKNCSGDSQFNSDKFSLVNPWLDFWEPASFSFLEWGDKFCVRELPLGEFFSWLLFILQSLVFSPGYLSMCTLSTCLLRFLVSFVKNACQQKIFKMSIKWVSDFYVFKIPGGWGT